jgi:predicted phosphodiesterase
MNRRSSERRDRTIRVALIADIHGNLPALEAVLDDVQTVTPDMIVCLGDVGAMGPFPAETLKRVRDLDCWLVMGNGDAAMLEPSDEQTASHDHAARRFTDMDRWCAGQIDEEHRAFIRTFQPGVTISLGDAGELHCCHGSPQSYDDVIKATTPDEELAPMFEGLHATVIAGGHWHFPMLRRYRHLTLFNPGSVGLPYEFDPAGEVFIPARAEYGVITADGADLRLEHRRVHYDTRPVIEAMLDRDFPHAEWWASKWQRSG